VGFAEPPPAKKRSEARERLLAAASLLFYAEGINSVGIERIIKEGQVTLATFYRHFPSKVDLVVAYLRSLDVLTLDARDYCDRRSREPATGRCAWSLAGSSWRHDRSHLTHEALRRDGRSG
jgi:AcrR family transcriptional regulator